VAGVARIAERRGAIRGPAALTGPGKVAAALGLDKTFSGRPLFKSRGLRVVEGVAPSGILVAPRVGIAYASAQHQAALWRFAAADTDYVTARKLLRPRAAPAVIAQPPMLRPTRF
jgi:DNA-3-methyladenine glycosylase